MATLKNKMTGEFISVHRTTDHPDSHYGHPVWVGDNDNVAYMECDSRFDNPLYELVDRQNFTAFYDTATMHNVAYSFDADSVDDAIEYCKFKFSVPVLAIMETTSDDCHFNEGRLVYLNGRKIE